MSCYEEKGVNIMSNSNTEKPVGKNNEDNIYSIFFLAETHLNYYSTLDEENKKELSEKNKNVVQK